MLLLHSNCSSLLQFVYTRVELVSSLSRRERLTTLQLPVRRVTHLAPGLFAHRIVRYIANGSLAGWEARRPQDPSKIAQNSAQTVHTIVYTGVASRSGPVCPFRMSHKTNYGTYAPSQPTPDRGLNRGLGLGSLENVHCYQHLSLRVWRTPSPP